MKNNGKLRVGIIGCGKISGIYGKNLTGVFSDIVSLSACADIVHERAVEMAGQYNIPRALSPEALIKDPDIDLVLNLTIPAAHFDVCLEAVKAGKHVYVEKPLCIEIEEANTLLETAKRKGVLVGSAPDTFMGAGIQTCRKLIDDGWIGEPVSAVAFMMNHGHESWHPAPEFYYKKGGGPMFDMGPYYLTALVSLIGPVKRLAGMTRITFPERTITSEPLRGTKIKVDVPTNVTGMMEFESGAIGTIITTFDVWANNMPRIEIYGSEGSLSVPDPNTFGGPVKVRRKNHTEWQEIPLTHIYNENSRGLGVADMACAVAEGRPHRASGTLSRHVLELMHGFHIANDKGTYYELKSGCARPEPLAMNGL